LRKSKYKNLKIWLVLNRKETAILHATSHIQDRW